MTILICCLGLGKGTWIPVMNVIKSADWEQLIIITNPFFKDKLPTLEHPNKKVIAVEEQKSLQELIQMLTQSMNLAFAGDVALNFFSGSGKEHMAILSAVLRSGCGVRLVEADEKGLHEV